MRQVRFWFPRGNSPASLFLQPAGMVCFVLAFYCITEPLPSSAQARSTTNQPRTFGGRAAAPAPAQKKDAATPPTAPDPEPAPNGGLPTDYKPPPAPPEMMTLEAPLLTEAQMENWKKIKSRYSSMVRGSSDLTSAADKQLLEEGLKYRLYIMTLKDQLDKRELHDRRLELTSTDLQTAGKLLKPQDVRKFRQTICEAIVRLTEPLLKNNFYVRLQAVTLLGELDLIVEDTPRNLKHEAYTPACEPLVTVLLDPEQPEAVKIAAARSIIRLMRYSQAPAELRQKVASAAISEFNRPGTHFWYQMRLAEVLSTIDSPVDLSTRKPFIVTALQNALRDPKRDVRVRAEAARSLGRVPLDPSVDISSVMRDIMALAQQMAAAQQQSPNQPIWKQVFFDLYLAFKQVDSNDRTPDKKSEGGLLNNPAASTLAKQTYPIIVPMVNDVLNDRQIKAPDVQKLQEWLAQNAPKAPPGAGTSEARPASTSSTTGVK